jgi:hypothetical protein
MSPAATSKCAAPLAVQNGTTIMVYNGNNDNDSTDIKK